LWGDFKLQAQQEFVAKYINEVTPYRGLMLWHGLGSGKTCSAINIANTFNTIRTKHKVVIAPASLMANFRGDYEKCGESTVNFDTVDRMKTVTRTGFVGPVLDSNSMKFIEYSTNGYASRYTDVDGADYFDNASIIVIDESQLLISLITSNLIEISDARKKIASYRAVVASPASAKQRQQAENFIFNAERQEKEERPYINLYHKLRSLEQSKIICLSGTPIVRTPFELAVAFNIIHGDIHSWQITGTTLATLYATMTPDDRSKIEDNIDKQSIDLAGVGVKIYKNPYGFINSLGGGIVQHNPPLLAPQFIPLPPDPPPDIPRSITNDEFTIILDRYFPGVVVHNIEPLFDTNDVDVVKNMPVDEFKRRVRGLSSYFGNIQSLMPSVTLDSGRGPNFLNDNRLYKYGIGFSNNLRPLYEIRYVKSSNLLGIVNRLGKDTVVSAIVRDQSLATKDFIYPDMGAWLTTYGAFNTKYNPPQPTRADEKERAEEIEVLKRREMERPLRNALFTELAKEVERIPHIGRVHLGAPARRADALVNGATITHYKNTAAYVEAETIARSIWSEATFRASPYMVSFNVTDPGCILQNCSPKIFEIVKSIMNAPTNRIHLIYSEYLKINIPLVRALQANGFNEYKKDMNGYPPGIININDPALVDAPRYMFYTGASEAVVSDKDDGQLVKFLDAGNTGEGKSVVDRDVLLKNFNDPLNNEGQKVRVIIINSAAAEGITIKNVRHVHLLHIPPNMSKLFQIIGRAIRNCTHSTLPLIPVSEQTVRPVLYVSGTEEEKFNKMIATNIENIPFLETLKESTIDCLMTKEIDPLQNCSTGFPIRASSPGYVIVDRLPGLTYDARGNLATPQYLGGKTRRHKKRSRKKIVRHRKTRNVRKYTRFTE